MFIAYAVYEEGSLTGVYNHGQDWHAHYEKLVKVGIKDLWLGALHVADTTGEVRLYTYKYHPVGVPSWSRYYGTEELLEAHPQADLTWTKYTGLVVGEELDTTL